MPDDQSSDIMMRFVLPSDRVIGEAMQWVDPSADKMLTGFEPSPTPDEWSNFFEVQEFSFNMSVKAKDDTVGGQGQAERRLSRNDIPVDQSSFRAFRIAGRNELDQKLLTYPVEFNSVKISRAIEASSPLLFYSCINNTTFKGATLVKRVSASVKGQMQQMGFLKFEFTDLLITSISWDDGDLVSESFEFICKAMDITYLQQLKDASLAPMPGKTVQWKQDRGQVRPQQGGR